MTPSFLRQHTITIINRYKDEYRNEKPIKKTVLNGVKVDVSMADSSIQQNKTNTIIKDTINVTIDDTQHCLNYTPFINWDVHHRGWTVHPIGDTITYNGMDLAIIAFEEIAPFGSVVRIEMKCQRR